MMECLKFLTSPSFDLVGPPSKLLQACDTSMTFLLGNEMSIGTVASIADAVNIPPSNLIRNYCGTDWSDANTKCGTRCPKGFDDDCPANEKCYDVEACDPYDGGEGGMEAEQFELHWFTWYKAQTCPNDDEWLDFYLNITRLSVDPEWLGWYSNLRDNDPWSLPGYGLFFCVDEVISNDPHSYIPLRNCQESWLVEFTNDNNPYSTAYESIVYPIDEPQFNETSCGEFQTCQLNWIEDDGNPFSKDEANGCYLFWSYCREYKPELIQCSRFFDYCHITLNNTYPNWQYPQPDCMDKSISSEKIDTCQEKWLDNTTNPYNEVENEACFIFFNYCKQELNATYPQYKWPLQYCDDNADLTCKPEWLDDTNNPYSSESNPECHSCWDNCRDNLNLETSNQWHWPPPPPPTTEGRMPGYCCADIGKFELLSDLLISAHIICHNSYYDYQQLRHLSISVMM